MFKRFMCVLISLVTILGNLPIAVFGVMGSKLVELLSEAQSFPSM